MKNRHALQVLSGKTADLTNLTLKLCCTLNVRAVCARAPPILIIEKAKEETTPVNFITTRQKSIFHFLFKLIFWNHLVDGTRNKSKHIPNQHTPNWASLLIRMFINQNNFRTAAKREETKKTTFYQRKSLGDQ